MSSGFARTSLVRYRFPDHTTGLAVSLAHLKVLRPGSNAPQIVFQSGQVFGVTAQVRIAKIVDIKVGDVLLMADDRLLGVLQLVPESATVIWLCVEIAEVGTGADTVAMDNWWAAGINSKQIPVVVPTGALLPFAGSSAPLGYLLCDGSAVNRETYSDLFAVLGITYGAGDTTTTFNLPDLQQRFPLGKATSGTGHTLGETGGAIDHSHTSAAHTHTSAAHVHSSAAHSHASAAHTHTSAAHVHSMGSHSHGFSATTGGNNNGTTATRVTDDVAVAADGHTHGFSGNTDNSDLADTGSTTPGATGSTTPGATGSTTPADTGSTTPGATGSTTPGVTGTNNPPFLALNFIIKT